MMYAYTDAEIRDGLIELIALGEIIAFFDDGEVKYISQEFATPEQKKNKLSVRELKHLYETGED